MIRRNPQTGKVSLDPCAGVLFPYWCQDPKGGRKPINAKCETVRNLPTFRDAYRRRRCIVPVDGYFEWVRREVVCVIVRRRQPTEPAVPSAVPYEVRRLGNDRLKALGQCIPPSHDGYRSRKETVCLPASGG